MTLKNENLSYGFRLKRLRDSVNSDRKDFAAIFGGGRWQPETLKNVELAKQKPGKKLIQAIEEEERRMTNGGNPGEPAPMNRLPRQDRLGLGGTAERVPIYIPDHEELPLKKIIAAIQDPKTIAKATKVAEALECSIEDAIEIVIRKNLNL